MSLRAPQARGNLKEQNSLEVIERSPRPYGARDDMRYTIDVQQTDKLEFILLQKSF